MIDLDPLRRLVIVLTAVSVIPLLLVLDWVACRTRDSCTAVLLRSWWRGHCRRLRRRYAARPDATYGALHDLVRGFPPR